MGRIGWAPDGMAAETGTVDGKALFRLAHPGDWSDGFVLSGPLVPGQFNCVELPGPGPEKAYGAGERPSRAQIVVDFKADRERWRNARAGAKAVAEALLIDFARFVLQDVDEPSKVG